MTTMYQAVLNKIIFVVSALYFVLDFLISELVTKCKVTNLILISV